MRLKVEGHPELYRDTESNAIIAQRGSAYQAHVERKRIDRERERRIECLECELKDIKELLKQLIQR